MIRLLLFLCVLGAAGCSAPQWVWQDTRAPARADFAPDLAACRSYAASQYRPGVPAGDPYLEQLQVAPAQDLRAEQDPGGNQPGTGTWHPDREPFPETNIRAESTHQVVVPYTGYPGYLDYHPGFLDALVEKCMRDRGWIYVPPPGGSDREDSTAAK